MKILFIATQLPPYNGSGNIRALNYINGIQNRGHKVDILGVKYPEDSIAYDKSLENSFNKNINIYRVNPGIFYKIFYRRKAKPNVFNETMKLNLKSRVKIKLNEFIRRNLLIPDSYLQWIHPAYTEGKKLIEKEKYDYIFSIHETPSSHIAAYKLKKQYPKVNWIGYWSDPWNNDSIRKKYNSKLKTKIEERMEYTVIKNMDKFFFTTESTRKMYVNKYNLHINKTEIVYRGYNDLYYEKLLENKNIPKNIHKNKINIVYVGTIYHDLRDISPLCSALDILKNKYQKIFNKLNITFLGQFDNLKDKQKLDNFNNVKIMDHTQYKEALRYIVYAECLLLYGNKNSLQIPGKVYEYSGSKAVILTILGDENDGLKEILLPMNKGPIILNEKEQIVMAIINIFNSYKENKEIWNKPCKKYIWKNVIKDLENKIIKK